MKGSYPIKVLLAKVTFVLLLMAGVVLYKFDLTDYIILILLIISFYGLVTLSNVEFTSRYVTFERRYFWAFFRQNNKFEINQIVSVKKIEYEFEPFEDIWVTLAHLVSPILLFDFLRPKVKSVEAKITFWDKEKGMKKSITVRLPQNEFDSINFYNIETQEEPIVKLNQE
jgi:hypothetical protein